MFICEDYHDEQMCKNHPNPKACIKNPNVFLLREPGDANFQVGLLKYVITAALYSVQKHNSSGNYTKTNAIWGNTCENVFLRCCSSSVNGIRGLYCTEDVSSKPRTGCLCSLIKVKNRRKKWTLFTFPLLSAEEVCFSQRALALPKTS